MWEESRSLPALWRARYNIPINDPRFLELTEDELLRDELMHTFARSAAERALFPGARVEDAAKAPDAVQQLQRLRSQVKASPGFEKALAAVRAGVDVDVEDDRAPEGDGGGTTERRRLKLRRPE